MNKNKLKIKTEQTKGTPILDYTDLLKASGFKLKKSKSKYIYTFPSHQVEYEYRVINNIGRPLTIIVD
jgi:hypothetical protein